MSCDKKYTPGPWKAVKYKRDEKSGYSYYISSSKGVVGYWRGHKDYHDDGYWMLTDDDANLIAAAPELLEVLDECILALEHVEEMGIKINPPCLSNARKASAKAKGET